MIEKKIKVRNKFVLSPVLFLFFLLLTGCSQEETFSRFYSFPDSVWKKEDIAVFQVNIPDKNKEYEVSIDIRNNNEYPFQNLWLFVELSDHADNVLSRDTINVELADIYGKWHGKGLSVYTYSLVYHKNMQYPDSGLYVYSIQQGMRSESLPGVSDIGLRVLLEKTNQ